MKAYLDLIKSFIHWRIWLTLAIEDIKLRYKRSTLGPLWITLSMAITIYSMGFLYGHLFRANIQEYFPFLAASITCWSLIATLVTESTNGFIESETYIKNINLPYMVYMLRLIVRNLIIFAHNLLAFIPIFFFFNIKVSPHLLLMLPGLIIIVINTITWGTIIGLLGTRFRDFLQIIQSLIQVVFFLTPIMWMPSLLPARLHFVVKYNPFNAILNLIRNPLLNKGITDFNFLFVLIITLVGIFLYAYLFEKNRNKIAFWL